MNLKYKYAKGDRVVVTGDRASFRHRVPAGTEGIIDATTSNSDGIVGYRLSTEDLFGGSNGWWIGEVDLEPVGPVAPTQEELNEVYESLGVLRTDPETVNHVYIVSLVWPWDGSSVVGVFTSLTAAQKSQPGEWHEDPDGWLNKTAGEYDSYYYIEKHQVQP